MYFRGLWVALLALVLIVLLGLLGACALPKVATEGPPRTQATSRDATSEATETALSRPTNSPTPTPREEPTFTSTPVPPPHEGEAVLYLGIMVHLEHWDDVGNKAEFERHAQAMREYATLFEEYGAKLTWESKELTGGIHKWGDNVLREMEQRGHGVGVHADIGGYARYDCSRFAEDLRAERERLEALGVTVRHVSGITSRCDWVTAAVEAGYRFTTGQVAFSVMSMPEEERPVAYRNCETPLDCHDVFPPRLEDRIHPWRMNSGADWLTHDPNGELVMLAASQGLACVEEELTDAAGHGCTFNIADLNQFMEQLEKAIVLSEPGKVNVYYVWWSFGEQELDPALVEEWLARVQPYVQSGQVEWKTLPEMYEAYVQGEQGN